MAFSNALFKVLPSLFFSVSFRFFPCNSDNWIEVIFGKEGNFWLNQLKHVSNMIIASVFKIGYWGVNVNLANNIFSTQFQQIT